MDEKFHWSDLEAWLADGHKWKEESREAFCIRLILSGQKVDLMDIPSVKGRRSPSKVKKSLIRMVSRHTGIAMKDGKIWIPELV